MRSDDAHRERLLSWVTGDRGFVAFIAYLAMFVALSYVPWPAEGIRTLIYLAVPAGALVLSIAAARSSAHRARWTWMLLSFALAAFLAGELAWAYSEHVQGLDAPPMPSAADAAFFAGYALILAAVVTLVGSATRITRFTKTRYLLDIVLMSLAGSSLVFGYVLWPAMLEAEPAPLAESLMLAAYPLADIILVSAFVALAMAARGVRLVRWQLFFAAGLLVTGVSDLAWYRIESVYGYEIGTAASLLLDTMWLTGYFMFAGAASHWLTAKTDRLPTETAYPIDATLDQRGTRWWEYAVPVAALLALVLLLLNVWPNAAGVDLGSRVMVLLSFALAAVVVLRSVVLSSENRVLTQRSVVDPLTGLYNHRFFHERLATEIERAARSGEPLSVALFDLDAFSRVNNTHGHPVGDRCLRWVAEKLAASIRSSDFACRVGGDEFGLIMPMTEAGDAASVCERIRASIPDGPQCVEPVTASVGIAGFPGHAIDAEDLLVRADGALYWAKRNGRDLVMVYDTEVVEDLSANARASRMEEQSRMHLVEVLAAAVDARDSYTQNHSRNVARLSREVARSLGFSAKHTELIGSAAVLHDVGKIGVSDAILRKDDGLMPDELAEVRLHPGLGVRILHDIPFREILPWIEAHHERWDGSGYPNGLRAEEIPVEARILAVCDSYDAMVSRRTYRQAISPELALEELRACAGTQFDPFVVDAFANVLASELCALPSPASVCN